MPQTSIVLSPAELEALIRRVVREELARLVRKSAPARREDQDQSGSDDPAEDQALLAEALALLQQYGDKPEAWVDWDDFEAEIDRAEAAGELPD